jgi:hypothetical protein
MEGVLVWHATCMKRGQSKEGKEQKREEGSEGRSMTQSAGSGEREARQERPEMKKIKGEARKPTIKGRRGAGA